MKNMQQTTNCTVRESRKKSLQG